MDWASACDLEKEFVFVCMYVCVCVCVCMCVIADARVSVCANRDDRKVKCNSLGGPFLF